MNKVEIEEITLIGLPLDGKTTNANGQSAIDCGNLWQKFEKGQYPEKIAAKLSEEIYAVYHQYEGDNTQPFSYLTGCKVKPGTQVWEGPTSLTIAPGAYQKITAKGKMPDCVAEAWKKIWSSDISRKYETDFELYDERSRDWNNAGVDIYISIKS